MRPLILSEVPAVTILTPLLFTRILVITAFSVTSSLGTHQQLPNVEKHHHELGAQRSELSEMQDELTACRAELALCRDGSQEDAVCAGSLDATDGKPTTSQATTDEARNSRGQIPTIVREGLADRADARKDAEAAASADFATYFYSYAELDHQKQMLEDNRRMEAYRNAMLYNRKAFEGKTVLDVGSGSGVLAIFAAQAGAKKVYAVEYTDMAKYARDLVEANGFSDVIEVIQSSVESVELPEKVDVIVSEFMGYFLLRESMIDSLVVARDKWLKTAGMMFPSHATMVWAAVDDENERLQKDSELRSAMSSWSAFVERSRQKYGFDMSTLDQAYRQECVDYFVLTSMWRELDHRQVLGKPVVVKELDLYTCSLGDTNGLEQTEFSFAMRRSTPPVTAFAGWFDVSFRGRDDISPLSTVVEFSTGPAAGFTHWGQQVFYLVDPIVAEGDFVVKGSVSMARQSNNPRLYDVKVEHRVSLNGEPDSETVRSVYKLS